MGLTNGKPLVQINLQFDPATKQIQMASTTEDGNLQETILMEILHAVWKKNRQKAAEQQPEKLITPVQVMPEFPSNGRAS